LKRLESLVDVELLGAVDLLIDVFLRLEVDCLESGLRRLAMV
jgi:hypothetical protein